MTDCPHLDLGVEMPENIIDLVLETARQHLVGLVQHKLLDLVSPAIIKRGMQASRRPSIQNTNGTSTYQVRELFSKMRYRTGI
jgi:hypothetical protein